MTFKQSIPRLVTGEIILSSMPAIALQALEQGLDTPSLRILAGLGEDENGFVLTRYLNDTLRELFIELPDKRSAAIEVGLLIAEEIFEGKRPVYEGTQEILWTLDRYPFYEESRNRRYDSIGFENIYVMFLTMEDLKGSGVIPWHPDPLNELSVKQHNDLLTALKEWATRMKVGFTL